MKLIRTVVATAVIVFALTTVATAGVQRLGGADDAGGGQERRSVAAHTSTPAAAQSAGAVTLSTEQFATLLHAMTHDRDRDRTRSANPAAVKQRAHDRDRRQTGEHHDGTRSDATRKQTHAQSRTHAQSQTQTQPRTHTQSSPQVHHGESGGNHGGGDHVGAESRHGGEHD